MTKPFASHYSVLRFAPYPETDEFVNVGVVLSCAAIGYLDYKRADLRRRGRVGKFFPELDANIYSAAMFAWEDSIKPFCRVPTDGQLFHDADQQRQREVFKTLVRPRESILFYSEPRVILSHDPVATLDEVFGAYVERRFANVPEYQERVMCRRLEAVFREADVLQRYKLNEKVGDDVYAVRFPFVKRTEENARPLQAIKALHLDRKDPTEIIRHADDWAGVVARLREFGTAPDELLFILRGPDNSNSVHGRAYDRVRQALDAASIPHLPEDATADILQFAAK